MLNQIKAIFSVIIIIALVLGSGLPLGGQPASAADGEESEGFSPELAGQLADTYQQKQALTPVQRKIDSRLMDVVRKVEERITAARRGETPKFRDLSTPLLKLDDTGNIEVKLTVTSLTAEQQKQLEDLGMNIRLTLSKYGVVEGNLPFGQVEAVAGLDFVVSVGTPGYVLHNVTSEGDAVLRANEARTGYGVDGSGIKVGVISDGVTNLSNSVATGDLPSSPAVDVLKAGSGDEGTAMLEIVHDLAPGAALAFYSPSTSSDMVAGIGALEAAGCKVIVDDLGWSDEPKFEDGPIAQEARQFVTDGGVYATAAGNSAQRHYMATYVRTTGPGGDYPYSHDYGGGDIGNTFTVPNGGTIIPLLQWNNQWGLSGDDFDLFLVRSSDGVALQWSTTAQNGNDNPWEGFSWTNTTGNSVSVFIAVLEYSLVSSPSSLVLDYHVWYGSGLQYVVSANSVIGHSAVEEILSTAAAYWSTPDTIESFSSRGPGTVYFPTYEEREVPNITGVDGVQTKTGQLGYFSSNPFYGTSASAPHVAAIAALVWDVDPTLTPSEVFNAVSSTAVDLGSTGWDSTWGFGRVDAYNAVDSVFVPLLVTTNAATDVTTNSSTLHGNLTSLGEYSSANVSFEWGTTSGSLTQETTPQAMGSTGNFSANLSSLSSATTHYFRAKASGNVTVYGNELSFTTSEVVSVLAVSSKTPPVNALDVIKTSNIVVQFNTSINGTSVNENTFNVDGSISGKVVGSYSGGGSSNITFDATSDFKAGETVTVTLTTGIRGENGATMVNPVTWQFVVDAPQGYARFIDSGQSLGSSNSRSVSLGDVDGDGDLDAFVANENQANKVWLNDGSGSFTDSGQSLGSLLSLGVALGDLDGDGDLDAFVANAFNHANKVWLNDGSGSFTDSGQSLGSSYSRSVALGDIDGDGDLDAFVANSSSQANRVWLNDGSGSFSDSGLSLGSLTSLGVALGDVDGDGDLDAFVTNYNGQANRVWLNNGSGNFSDSGQSLGSSWSFGLSLGDVDGDGDLDAFVANSGQANRVWLNNGSGNFTDSGQSLGSLYSSGVSLGDVDGDDDLDAFVANAGQANKVWLNDGSGSFRDSGQSLDSASSYDVALGDIDGDGDLDAFVANFSNQANRVWLNVPLELVSIAVTPTNPSVTLGLTQQFTATGTYTDSSQADITSSVTWTSSNTSAATINSATGLATTVAEGSTTITATSGSISGTTTLTVTAPVLLSITVTPSLASIPLGLTQQFTATGTYTNGPADITGTATWASTSTSVATINATGLATTVAEGSTTITATSGSISDNATLTVTVAVLDSVTVTPVDPVITFVSGNPPTLQFIATADYSDGATTDVSDTASWASDNTSVATIDADGLATTVAAGTTTITADYNGTTGNVTLTVLPDTVAPVVTLTSPTEGLVLSSTNLMVSGTVDDVATSVSVDVNGAFWSPLVLEHVSGNFSDNVTLNAGSNTILVKAVDGGGNTGTSGTITVTVSPNKPGIIITQPLAGTVTNSSNMTVMGTVSGNVTTANLILNGVSQSVSVSGGSFSANVTLVEGINILVINAYDASHAGDSDYMGTSGVRMVTLDTTAPAVTIDCPISGSVVSTPGCEVSGTIDDPGVSTANLTLNGTSRSIHVVGGAFSQRITLVSGNNTITVTATDEVGNTSSDDSLTAIFDNTKPEVVITAPANRLMTNTAIQAVTGIINDASITTATLYINGTPQTIGVAPSGSYGSFSKNVTLATGANTLEVTASDGASNTGTSGVVNVTLDNTAPTITIGLNDPTDSIAITVTSDEALAEGSPTTSINSTLAVTMTQIDVNKWRGTYGSAGSPIVDGAYTVTANATDKAGNMTIRTATFGKQTVTTVNMRAEVVTATTTLEIQTTTDVTAASVSVTQHLDNPSGNVGNPEGAEKAAGAFVEIVVSPELRDNLEQIYIKVDYDPDELPADTDESTLKLYLWDVASGAWQVVPGSGVNTGENYIYGTVTHLSKYGGFGSIPEPTPTPTGPAPGGGGGGGGGGLEGLISLSPYTTMEGKLFEDVIGMSGDKKVTLSLLKGTIARNRVGSLLPNILIQEKKEQPAPPVSSKFIGLVYDIYPDGATFDPPITLTFKYDTSEIPQGVSENNLFVAKWDKVTETWVELESTVDQEPHTVLTEIGHLSDYAVMTYTRPASFTTADLTITPKEVNSGESLSISVLITNTGDLTGNHKVDLEIDNVVVQTKEVAIDGGNGEMISFSVTPDTTGEHTASIGDLFGTFKVKTPEVTPAPTPLPAVVPTPAIFAISDLSITPSEVKPAEQVTITVVVTNTGGTEGSYTVVLKVNGAEEAKKEVTVGTDKRETITFAIAKDAEGSYAVDIDGKIGQFTVIVPPPPTPTPVEALPIQPSANWWLFGGIIAGCVVIAAGLLAYFLVWRKRSAPRTS